MFTPGKKIVAIEMSDAALKPTPSPRWTPDLQRAADDIRDAAFRAREAYDLTTNQVLVAMAMAAKHLTPRPTRSCDDAE